MSSAHFFTPLIVTDVPSVDHEAAGLQHVQEILATFKTNEIKPVITLYASAEGFKIEDARKLQTQLSFAAVASQPQVYVIEQFQTATIPAQNALLKQLEEPPTHTLLVLVTTTTAPLLETLKSRCTLVYYKASKTDDKTGQSPIPEHPALSNLLSLTVLEKIDLALQLKERETATAFCHQALRFFHAAVQQNPDKKELQKTVHILLTLNRRLAANCNPQLVVETALFSLPS